MSEKVKKVLTFVGLLALSIISTIFGLFVTFFILNVSLQITGVDAKLSLLPVRVALIAWLIGTTFHTAAKRSAQGLFRPLLIPGWIVLVSVLANYGGLIALAALVHWSLFFSLWIVGFLLACFGATQHIGAFVLALIFPRDPAYADWDGGS